MADRLASLRRIAEVQAQMVKLAEWRIAAADRKAAELGQDRARLVGYVGATGALGVPLAQAALRATHALDRRIAEAVRDKAAETAKLETLRRRDKAVGTRVAEAATAAQRAAEQAELTEIMEAWLARKEPSLRAQRSNPGAAEDHLDDGARPPLGCFASGSQ